MIIKNVVLGVAIMILTISAVIYGVNTFYDAPEYEDFCASNLWEISNQQDCESAGGLWRVMNENEKEVNPLATCTAPQSCYDEFDAASEIYHRNLFLITLPLGIILMVAGLAIFGFEVVGAGIGAGGIGVILWGVLGYWQYGSDLLRFSLSLIGLIVVVWFTYWINKRGWKIRKR